MIEETASFLSLCPQLAECGVKVNYLEEKPLSCALKMKTSEPVVKKYSDGGRVGEERFVLALRQEYTGAASDNRRAAKRCEEIEKWIEEQTSKGIYPQLENNRVPLSLTVEKTFEINSTGGIDARFEAELRLVFYSPSK
ncbi:MAG: hypothetical protein IJ285_06310 [Clostridia bacterium]|nr:hypothetical protein [Oscillospiraceae bacterium]MBQ7960813.1 hypothetical protein [Clostridia bacterium]